MLNMLCWFLGCAPDQDDVDEFEEIYGDIAQQHEFECKRCGKPVIVDTGDDN